MSNQNDFKLLKGADKVRKQPNVMLGSNDIKGVRQGLFEIASNSIDRYRRGFGNRVDIIKHKDLSYEVIDYADGLPTAWNEEESAYNWELGCRILYSGANYDKDSESLGQHGLGLASTILSSKYAHITSFRNNIKSEFEMVEGRPINKDTKEFICDDSDTLFSKEDGNLVLRVGENTEGKCGTNIKWKPDENLFTDINIDLEWIKDKFKKQALVNNGLTINIIDEYDDENITYCYENGILDYVKELNGEEGFGEILHFEDNGSGRDKENMPIYNYRYEVSIAMNNSKNLVECYHNSSELLNGGSTLDAIKKALTDVIDEYCTKYKLYKDKEKHIKFSDIEDSLICVISSFSNMTSFADQTKLSINNKFIKDFTVKTLKDKLKVYFIENENDGKRICEQILVNKRSSENAEKTRMNFKNKLSKKNTNGMSVKIEGLRDCDMKKSKFKDRIILLTEGLSANETVCDSFDNLYMGSYGLKGRFINSLKSSVKKVLENEPAIGLINAIGCGIELPPEEKKLMRDFKTFNNEESRYNYVGILCDADAFGKGIALSLITFFYKYMPQLLKDNRINMVISPRHEIYLKNDEILFAYNDSEKDEIVSKYGDKISHIGLVKGLGELNADEFWEYVLSPEAREKTFITIEYRENEEEFLDEIFEKLMGDDIQGRKEFIKNNITNINLNEVE